MKNYRLDERERTLDHLTYEFRLEGSLKKL
jgi:hypothetical protein